MCDDLPCISACPDNALLPVSSPGEVNMGYAILDKKKCQAYGDTFCQQCIIDCPIPGAITQNKDQQPEFHKKICTGCGVCVRSCSTVNIPVAIKVKPLMVTPFASSASSTAPFLEQSHRTRTNNQNFTKKYAPAVVFA